MSDDKKVYEFGGQKVDVAWDGRLCIHIGECTRAQGALFESGRDPWGQPDNAEADHVAAVVERCPTGALTYARKDGGGAEVAEPKNTVAVVSNGPLYLRGNLQIDGAPADMPGVRFHAALCRCGGSANKPFCDNTHESNGFRDRGAVGETGTGTDSDGGPLSARPAPDGPLLLNGNLEILNGAGRSAWRGTKAALCRCGASRNKPFCDGAHKEAGFKAD